MDSTWRILGLLVPRGTSSDVGARSSFLRALFVPALLTSNGGPPTDETGITIRLGSLTRVVVKQELGGQNLN